MGAVMGLLLLIWMGFAGGVIAMYFLLEFFSD
jgi:hypothetical protein